MYTFDPMIENQIKSMTSGLSKRYPNVDRYILDNHNDICVCCKAPFKKYNNVLQHNAIGSIGAYLPNDDPMTAIPYLICKKCKRQLEKERVNKFALQATTDRIDDYIFEKTKLQISSMSPKTLKHIDISASQKHKYNPIAVERIEKRIFTFVGAFSDYTIDRTVIDYLNSSCPMCRNELPVTDGELQNCRSVNAVVDHAGKLIVPCVICNECGEFFSIFLLKRHDMQKYQQMMSSMEEYVDSVMFD